MSATKDGDGATGASQDGGEAAVSRFVERFAAEMTEAGMQRMAARVFASLLASDESALTSAELSRRLQISPAAVSGAVRYLTQAGMVGREREPGSRRDRYRLHNDLWFETFTRRDQLLARWEKVLHDGVESLGPDSPAGLRLAETAAFMAFLDSELKGLMKRWHAHRETLDLGPRS